jgi:hypothetical protein
MLDRWPLDRLFAAATLLAAIGAWLRASERGLVDAISLAFPIADLLTLASLLTVAVWCHRYSVGWRFAEWLAVGGLATCAFVWGFSIGTLFVAPTLLAVIAAVLATAIRGPRSWMPATFVVVGVLIELIAMRAAGYLNLGAKVLSGSG